MSRKWLRMVRPILAACVVLAGVACIALGVTWRRIVPADTFWSPAQAQEFSDASVALKSVAMRPDRRASQTDDPQLEAAQARFDRIQTELENAISRRDRSGFLVAIAGVVVVVSGVAIFLRGHTASPDR